LHPTRLSEMSPANSINTTILLAFFIVPFSF